MNLEEIKEVLDYGKESIRNNPRLFTTWRNVYNENFADNPLCLGCGDGFGDAFNYMQTVYNQLIKNPKSIIMANTDKKFILKDGGVLQSEFGTFSPTAAPGSPGEMNDEIALDHLKRSKNFAAAFKKMPDDWEKLVDEHPTMAEKLTGKKEGSGSDDLSTKTKAQLQELAKTAGYPEEEYSKLNKTELLAYLEEKKATV